MLRKRTSLSVNPTSNNHVYFILSPKYYLNQSPPCQQFFVVVVVVVVFFLHPVDLPMLNDFMVLQLFGDC